MQDTLKEMFVKCLSPTPTPTISCELPGRQKGDLLRSWGSPSASAPQPPLINATKSESQSSCLRRVPLGSRRGPGNEITSLCFCETFKTSFYYCFSYAGHQDTVRVNVDVSALNLME